MNDDPGIRRRLPAGIVDSGFASLATFIIGLTAVNLFDDVDRGIYAVFFTAFLSGSLLASEFVFTPAEVVTVERPVGERLAAVPRTLAIGLGPCVLGASASLIAVLITVGYADPEVVTVLAFTSALTAVISPMQDHVRKMLHIAAESWAASVVSIVQFVAAGSLLLVAVASDVAPEWIPFGVLALANTLSFSVGLFLVRRLATERMGRTIRIGEIAGRGVWFVANAAAPALSGFAVAAIITWLAGPEELGYAESARVVAQPVYVLATGLRAVLHPRSIRSALDGDRSTARRTNAIFLSVTLIASAGYLVLVGWDWALNPMAVIVPSAYVLGGLVALTIVANAANAAWFMGASELAGAHRERSLAGIAWTSSAVSTTVALSASVTGAFARPLGSLASAGVRQFLQVRSLDSHYGRGAAAPERRPPLVDDA